MAFKIGDRVRIVRSDIPSRVGVVATVTSDLTQFCSCGVLCGGGMVHQLDLPGMYRPGGNYEGHGAAGCVAAYTPDCLEPVYDGNELVSWESCVWQPQRVRM